MSPAEEYVKRETVTETGSSFVPTHYLQLPMDLTTHSFAFYQLDLLLRPLSVLRSPPFEKYES